MLEFGSDDFPLGKRHEQVVPVAAEKVNTFAECTDIHPAFHHPVASAANTNPPDRLTEIVTCKPSPSTENTPRSRP